MITFRMFGRDYVFELWCPVRETDRWEFGSESFRDEFDKWLFWFGPLHLATSKMNVLPVTQ